LGCHARWSSLAGVRTRVRAAARAVPSHSCCFLYVWRRWPGILPLQDSWADTLRTTSPLVRVTLGWCGGSLVLIVTADADLGGRAYFREPLVPREGVPSCCSPPLRAVATDNDAGSFPFLSSDAGVWCFLLFEGGFHGMGRFGRPAPAASVVIPMGGTQLVRATAVPVSPTAAEMRQKNLPRLAFGRRIPETRKNPGSGILKSRPMRRRASAATISSGRQGTVGDDPGRGPDPSRAELGAAPARTPRRTRADGLGGIASSNLERADSPMKSRRGFEFRNFLRPGQGADLRARSVAAEIAGEGRNPSRKARGVRLGVGWGRLGGLRS